MPLPLARWQLPLALGAAASGGAGTWQLPLAEGNEVAAASRAGYFGPPGSS